LKRLAAYMCVQKAIILLYHYPGAIRPVVIPKYKEVPTFVIRNNMRIIGMSREKYFEFFGAVE